MLGSKYCPQPDDTDTDATLKFYAGIGTLRQEGWKVTDLPSVVDRRELEEWRRPKD